MKFPSEFDVIVIGGGHAGTEAALAAARMGRQTLSTRSTPLARIRTTDEPALAGSGSYGLLTRALGLPDRDAGKRCVGYVVVDHRTGAILMERRMMKIDEPGAQATEAQLRPIAEAFVRSRSFLGAPSPLQA